MGEAQAPKARERRAVFVFGVAFVVILLAIALRFPEPSPFQYTVFRIVLALAAAGVAAFIPGFVNVVVKGWVRAGGAMAVFVIVYFFSPAYLVVGQQGEKPPSGNIQQIGTIDQQNDSGSNTAGVQGNPTNKNQSDEADGQPSGKARKQK